MKIEATDMNSALEFYMLVNQLKYILIDKRHNQSIADQIYGSMILATAINSEYNKVDNLGLTLRTILFSKLYDVCPNELISCFKNMNKGKEYSLELQQYLASKSVEYSSSKFAFDCIITECAFINFFENFLTEEQINCLDLDGLFNIAKNYGVIDHLGNDEKKNYEIFRFYYLNLILKKKIRTGWDSNHWNISISRIERISEHIVCTIALAIAFASVFNFDINLDQVISTLNIHEVGEIIISDITPHDGITPEKKLEMEHKAIITVIGNLSKNKEMVNSLLEFDERKTNNAMFAYYCDKLEADLQAKIYQDMGYHHPLTNQKNNVTFKNPKVQKMLADGATSAFDIWYEWDKPLYIKSPVFTLALTYVKNTNLISQKKL